MQISKRYKFWYLTKIALHKNLFIVLLILLLFTNFLSLKAQQKEIKRDNQIWTHYISRINFTPKFSLRSDFLLGRREGFSENSMYILRTGVGYKISKEVSITLGYAFLGIYDHSGLIKREHRPYQDLFIKQRFRNFSTSHRLRIEERFLNRLSYESNPSENFFNFRIRYRFLFSIPILKFNKESVNKTLFFRAGDEIFLNSGNEIVNNVFDQNWLFGGLGFKFNPNFAVVLTYNYRFIGSSIAGNYKQENVFWFALKHVINKENK